jgi:hypothetical protein
MADELGRVTTGYQHWLTRQPIYGQPMTRFRPEMSLRRSFHLFLPHRLAFASKQPHEGVDVVNAEKQKRASAGELNRSTP